MTVGTQTSSAKRQPIGDNGRITESTLRNGRSDPAQSQRSVSYATAESNDRVRELQIRKQIYTNMENFACRAEVRREEVVWVAASTGDQLKWRNMAWLGTRPRLRNRFLDADPPSDSNADDDGGVICIYCIVLHERYQQKRRSRPFMRSRECGRKCDWTRRNATARTSKLARYLTINVGSPICSF